MICGRFCVFYGLLPLLIPAVKSCTPSRNPSLKPSQTICRSSSALLSKSLSRTFFPASSSSFSSLSMSLSTCSLRGSISGVLSFLPTARSCRNKADSKYPVPFRRPPHPCRIPFPFSVPYKSWCTVPALSPRTLPLPAGRNAPLPHGCTIHPSFHSRPF